MVFRRPELSQVTKKKAVVPAIKSLLKSQADSKLPTADSSNSQILQTKFSSNSAELSKQYQHLVQMSASRISCFVIEKNITRQSSHDEILHEIFKGRTFLFEANDSFARACSAESSQELIGKSFSTFFSERLRPMFQNWIDSNFFLPNYEYEDKETGLTLLNSVYGSFDKSRLHSFWIVARDVSEMYKALHELQAAEMHYRTLVERPGLVLVRTKLDGSYLYLSPHVKDIVGYDINDFKNTPGLFARLLHPDDVELHERIILRARREKRREVVEVEYRVRCLDGTYRWFFERQSPKFDMHGELEYFDSIALDIQEKKTLERELLQAQRMETIGNLASGIAHDFNNHLTAMLGQIRIALNHLPPLHPAYKCLLGAETTGLRSAEMTKNLLRFGKGESSKRALINIREFLEETVSLISYLLPSNIETSLQFSEPLANINGNYAELQQVLFNLAVNARDAMPQGGNLKFIASNLELLSLRTLKRFKAVEPGFYTQVCITDTGEGIKSSILPYIFDPFFSTKAPGKGSGLGLSMVYSIIKSHAAFIELESSEGQGSSFFLLFPSQNGTLAKTKKTTDYSNLRGSEFVLIVEDDESVLQVVSQSLKMHGYQILSAVNGEDALRLYKENRDKIQLSILDLTIPKISGQQLLREIRELSPSARVVITSGYQEHTTNLDKQDIIFLPKPYLLPDLLRAVRHALENTMVSKHSMLSQP